MLEVNQQFILRVLLLFVILLLLLWLFRLWKGRRLEKRIARYTVDIERESSSYFDQLEQVFFFLAKKISKVLCFSTLLKKWGTTYEEIASKEKDREGIDFLSLKVLAGTFFLICFFLSILFLGKSAFWWEYIGMFLLGFLLPDLFFSMTKRVRRKRIEEDFFQALTVMNHSFRSGKSIYQVVSSVRLEMEGPIQEEFELIARDLAYGLSIEESLTRFANRVPLSEVKYLTSSLILLNQTGGEIKEIFDVIEKNLISRKKLKHEMKSLTATATFLYRFLAVVPLILVGVLLLLNPNYFTVLFQTWVGREILLLLLFLYVTYLIFVKRIMKVEEL